MQIFDNKRIQFICIGIFLFISLFALFFVKFNTRFEKQEMYKLEKLMQEKDQEIQMLRAELTYLKRPQNIKNIAKNELQLRPIKKKDVL